MNPFINFAELQASGGSFSKQEVTASVSDGVTTTVIYGGYAPCTETGDLTDTFDNWLIRRLVVVEEGSVQRIECAWAKGAWIDREHLLYTYYKP